MKKYTGDFETAVWLEDETWVWAWAVCEIGNESNIIIGNNIDSFMEFCMNSNNPEIYFHNLKFDGEFIINWLLENGFKYIKDKKEKEDNTFTTLISGMGQWYSMEVFFKVGNKRVQKVTFFDSLKIIPFSVEAIAKSFNLKISKLSIDYKKPRSKNHILTAEEKEYIKNDVLIVAQALNVLFKENLKKMTQGSNALNDFKQIVKKKRFERYFPPLEKWADEDIRKAYKGGFTYLNPVYKNKIVGAGVVLDVNSLYPSVMMEKLLPFGEGKFFEGKYKQDNFYPLYIQSITCSFKLKEGKIPTIQLKAKEYKWEFLPNEYVESSHNKIINLVLTNIDLKLFLENYEVHDLEYLNGWKFKGMHGIFNEYITKWITRKNEATISGNKGQRTLAKLMLNALYGKFATSLVTYTKIPYLNEDGVTCYHISEPEDKKGIYIPMGAFITAYAREKTIRTSQAIKDYSIKTYGKDLYCYSDTDSIHTLLPIEELKQFCEIDDVELGKWKHESSFTEAKFVRQKCYVEKFGNEYNITCAGLPKKCMYKKDGSDSLYYKTYELDISGKEIQVEKEFKLKDFEVGFVASGKLSFKHVKGGVILVDTDFSIKEDKIISKFNN